MRLAYEWPMESSRSGRSLKEALMKRIRFEFKNKKVDNMNKEAVMKHAQIEYESLNNLLQNQLFEKVKLKFGWKNLLWIILSHKLQYPIDRAYFPMQAKNSKQLLSTAEQLKREKKRESFMQKLSNFIFARKKKTTNWNSHSRRIFLHTRRTHQKLENRFFFF